MEHARMPPDDARLFGRLVEGFYGASIDDISLASIAADRSGAGGDDAFEQLRIRGGYQRLVDWLAARIARAGVVVRHRSVARAIDWSGDGVRIELEGGDVVAARRAIVTLPIGVLPSLRFAPALEGHAAALSRFAMGQITKIVLCLREPVWREDMAANDMSFVHGRATAFPTFWLRPCGASQQLTAWAGGPHALALAGNSIDQLVARAVDGFTSTVGIPRARLEATIIDCHHHDFTNDPHSLGAYSYTRVGGSGAARVLAGPLGDKLYFAGEATHEDNEGTVTGALESGMRAAKLAMA
jgi:monoamine oxidase